MLTRWAADGLDVLVYFDNDAKVRAPFDAAALIARVRWGGAVQLETPPPAPEGDERDSAPTSGPRMPLMSWVRASLSTAPPTVPRTSGQSAASIAVSSRP